MTKTDRKDRKNFDRKEMNTRRYCEKCNNPIESCLCDEIEKPERRQHNRSRIS